MSDDSAQSGPLGQPQPPRRRMYYSIRRRRYVGLGAPLPSVDAGEVQDAATAQKEELEKLRERLNFSQAMSLRIQQEKGEAVKVARQWKDHASSLESDLEAAKAALAETTAKLAARDKFVEESKRVVEQAKSKISQVKSDMDQQRRRFARETDEVRLTAEAKLMEEMFPSLDNFQLAIETVDKTGDAEGFLAGMRMIHRTLFESLQRGGLEVIDPKGEVFDPNKHDAVAVVENHELPDRTVAEVMRPGFSLRGKVLRPAMVMVNKLEQSVDPDFNVEDIEFPDVPGEILIDPNDFPPLPDDEAEPQDEQKKKEPTRKPEDTGGGKTPIDRAWKYLDSQFDE